MISRNSRNTSVSRNGPALRARAVRERDRRPLEGAEQGLRLVLVQLGDPKLAEGLDHDWTERVRHLKQARGARPINILVDEPEPLFSALERFFVTTL